MNILGLAGGLNRPDNNIYQFPWFFHDSAAVLVQSGHIRFAVEEERLNRIKHTTCFPVESIAAALAYADLSLTDVDHFAYFFSEHYINNALQMVHRSQPGAGPFKPVREQIGEHIRHAFPPLSASALETMVERVEFVDHHLSHAASAWYPSGFASALVMVIDGLGENVSVTIYDAGSAGLEVLDSYGVSDSLGLLYLMVTEHLGYSIFDEYKVMGLAPYGDASRFGQQFDQLVQFDADGRYSVDRKQMQTTLNSISPKRAKTDSFEQIHKDIAAAIQQTLERIIGRLAAHWQRVTGHRNLAMAGGVAHNCTNNGKLLIAGTFENIFVQPASHDAGCALGAALHVAQMNAGPGSIQAAVATGTTPIYTGKDIGDPDSVRERLACWEPLIRWEKPADLFHITARRLASGEVAGWVQGRAEFGPRALGNRSIIADPRPVSNKDRVNLMVKKREAYRPFAPAVLSTELTRFYEPVSGHADLSHMTYALQTRPEYVETLGAVTHVNGSARVQTVSADRNERFAALIQTFGQLTDIPVLLNTSFNNNVEPVIDSIDDAITCFLTTGLNFLVIGDYLIEREADTCTALGDFAVDLYSHVPMIRNDAVSASESGQWCLSHRFNDHVVPLSDELAEILHGADGRAVSQHPVFASAQRPEILRDELYALWDARLVRISVPGQSVQNRGVTSAKRQGQQQMLT